MTRQTRKRLILSAVGLVVVAAVVYGFLPQPVGVDTAVVQRGPLRVTVEEEGRTRVAEAYTIAAPVAAYARRLDVGVGDRVEAGQPVVQLESPRATDLDPRSRAEASARAGATRAMLAQAREQVAAAVVAAERTAEERDRLARLAAVGSATPRALEQAESEAAQAAANLQAARATAAAAQADVSSAEATLQPASAGGVVQQTLRVPAAGRVLAVHRRSAGPVSPGEPLLEVGDTGRLEVVVNVLSQDAVRISHGSRVMIDQWGGEYVLEGVVERVEPQAFTQVSALGVEEQRVSVIVALLSPPAASANLGAGYRLLAHFIIWEGDGVLQVPAGALFRNEGGWSVFVLEGGRAHLRPVEVGHRAGLAAQVTSGLSETDVVIMHPDARIADRVRARRR